MEFRCPRLLLGFAVSWSLASVVRADLPDFDLGVRSPDRHLAVDFEVNADGTPEYSVKRDGLVVLRTSKLGLQRDDVDFTRGLRLVKWTHPTVILDRYELLTGKRRKNHYEASRAEYFLETPAGQKMTIIFQVSNDGVAFRYFFPETRPTIAKITREATTFHFPADTRAWLQPMSVAKTGWSQVNPCYEEFYEKDIAAGTPSPSGAGWVYPALFRTGDTWVALTEASLGRSYCGTRLATESPDNEYAVAFPDPREKFPGGAVNPESTLPWTTPWRIIALGSLKTIVESTLGTDLADDPAHASKFTYRPGKASWSWPLLGDAKTTFDVQKRFIDYASQMNWRYCLIDSMWDQQIGYDRIGELVDYARTKNVSILLWYNSNGDWNSAPQTPRNRMLTHESRVQEFKRLKALGVAGLKIDFFGGDGQSMIDYYQDILDDAAPYGFLINFHGATLPRGWERTYPQLMTMEAVKGEEYITFEQKNADEEPAHAATLPFARNLFDPMDFTPMVLDHINHIERRTTSAFELALSVVFTSGITHYAEIPEGMEQAPDFVRDFLRAVPSIWDDTRFLDGYPGRFIVLARRAGDRWYIAGINGDAEARELHLNLSGLGRVSGEGVADGGKGNLSFRRLRLPAGTTADFPLKLAAHDGFVLVVSPVK
ncbi:MAG TPA: glycoside hydrolase family 97 catalytic domain-containing protein [Candidatus Didemnitutus sp.]|nr:glycoside hydrolase family 97 catalytic domain-containing protein [Candidatus Didemnitutus sp.]